MSRSSPYIVTEDSQYGVWLQGEPDNERLGKRLKGDFKKVSDWLRHLVRIVVRNSLVHRPPPPSFPSITESGRRADVSIRKVQKLFRTKPTTLSMFCEYDSHPSLGMCVGCLVYLGSFYCSEPHAVCPHTIKVYP